MVRSGWRSSHRGAQHPDRAGRGVDLDVGAEGKRELAVDVADERAAPAGTPSGFT